MSIETGRLPHRGSWAKGKIGAGTCRAAKKGANRARRAVDRRAERGDECADTRGIPTRGWAW